MSDQPAPGSRDVAPIQGTIWHLSDLHFDYAHLPGKVDGKVGLPEGAEHVFDREVFEKLFSVAAKEPADFLVLSGDFVDAGSLKGGGRRKSSPPPASASKRQRVLKFAAEFAAALAQAHGLDGEMATRVIVCPGNHDVDWSKAAAAADRPHSRDDFWAAMKGFLHPQCSPPVSAPDGKGVTFLTLDTSFLGGAEFQASRPGKSPVRLQTDAAGYAVKEIKALLTQLGAGTTDGRANPRSNLGVVVAHHPPAITPTGDVEAKFFEIPIAAAQAKQELHKHGFRIVLHGHKHMGIVHHEELSFVASDGRMESFLIIGTEAFAAGRGGFNVIRYLVSPTCGEARIIVTPWRLNYYEPSPEEDFCFALRAPYVEPTSLLRVRVRILPNGFACTDIQYLDVPVHAGDGHSGTWMRKGNSWLREFDRVEEAPEAMAAYPQVIGLAHGVEAEAVNLVADPPDSATRTFQVRVDVPHLPLATRASFMERRWTYGAFATTRVQQRRQWGDNSGREHVRHAVREPTRRLEFDISLPFAPDDSLYPELQALQLNPVTNTWEEKPDYLTFTRYSVEENPRTREIHAVVEEPVVGVSYRVRWRLREDDPLRKLDNESKATYEQELADAERVRAALLKGRENPAGDWRAERFEKAMNGILLHLYEHRAAAPSDDIEWGLFVPNTPLTRDQASSGQRPYLVPLYANYPADHQLWTERWAVGIGLVGRAFAFNSLEKLGTLPSGSAHAADPWNEPDIQPYRNVPGMPRHTRLWALPVSSPRRREADVVWGVLCIGSRQPGPMLDLTVVVPRSQWTPSPEDEGGAPAEIAIIGGMHVFSREIWNLG